MSVENKDAAQFVNAGLSYANGLILRNSAGDPEFQIDISPGQARDSTNIFDLISTKTEIVNLQKVGFGGRLNASLDAGWYAIFILSSSLNGGLKTIAILHNENSGLPTVPNLREGNVTYDINRFLGWVRYITPENTLLPFEMVDRGGNYREIYWSQRQSLFSAIATEVFTVQTATQPFGIPPSAVLYSATIRFDNRAGVVDNSGLITFSQTAPATESEYTFKLEAALGDLSEMHVVMPVNRTSGSGEIFIAGNLGVAAAVGVNVQVSQGVMVGFYL